MSRISLCLPKNLKVSLYSNCSHTVEDVAVDKTIKQFHNQKPWVDREERALVMERNIALKSGDKDAYSVPRGKLRVGIRKAKQRYNLRLEKGLGCNSTRIMWTIEELNRFYGHFDHLNNDVITKLSIIPGDMPYAS